MPEGGDVNDIRICRMNSHPRDDLGLGETHVRPGLPGIDGFVNPIALHDVAAQARFAHADVNDVRVRFGHRDGAHR